MWWWMLIEATGYLLFGAPHSATWKRRRFARHFGVDGYEAVLGKDIQKYLCDQHKVPEGWSWQVSLRHADKDSKKFEVKYDDCGGRAGVIGVHLADAAVSYERIDPEPDESGNREHHGAGDSPR